MDRTQFGTSIRLFLVDGTPEGLRIVDKSNWNGVAAVSSRAEYASVRARDEFGRPGVYVLVGPSESDSILPRIYIGEADTPRKRLDIHLANKDFWTRVVVFGSKDGTLNKAHARYVESRLVQLAYQVKRAEVENGNAPQLPPLTEADRADAEAFLREMLVIFPVLGVTAFEAAVDRGSAQGRLRIRSKLASAEGQETPDGFLVYEGSVARAATVPSIHPYLAQLREKLLEQGILVHTPEGLRFTQDYAFNSPSTAASVLLGRATNGRTKWRDNQGITLKALQARVVD